MIFVSSRGHLGNKWRQRTQPQIESYKVGRPVLTPEGDYPATGHQGAGRRPGWPHGQVAGWLQWTAPWAEAHGVQVEQLKAPRLGPEWLGLACSC